MQDIASSNDLPINERIQVLGSAARAGKHVHNPHANEYQIEVSQAAVSLLVQIPGHAEYYQERIINARERLDALDADSYEVGVARQGFANRQSEGFLTLSMLPSVETVRVLGEFLYDDRGRPQDEEALWRIVSSDGVLLENPSSEGAAVALGRLIANPPYPPRGFVNQADLEVWKLWYEQVEAGNRTFRFKDDPQEYTLAGPARVPAAADPGRTGKRPAPGADEPPTAGRSPARAVLWMALVAILGYAVWRFLRHGPREAGKRS